MKITLCVLFCFTISGGFGENLPAKLKKGLKDIGDDFKEKIGDVDELTADNKAELEKKIVETKKFLEQLQKNQAELLKEKSVADDTTQKGFMDNIVDKISKVEGIESKIKAANDDTFKDVKTEWDKTIGVLWKDGLEKLQELTIKMLKTAAELDKVKDEFREKAEKDAKYFTENFRNETLFIAVTSKKGYEKLLEETLKFLNVAKAKSADIVKAAENDGKTEIEDAAAESKITKMIDQVEVYQTELKAVKDDEVDAKIEGWKGEAKKVWDMGLDQLVPLVKEDESGSTHIIAPMALILTAAIISMSH